MPVGAYLSGGLDSSLISALAQIEKGRRAAHLLDRLQGPALRRARPAGGGRAGARHQPPRRRGRARARSRGRSRRSSATPRRRWCGPRPCRSSCSPREVRANDLKVVITGEGADELFWGYDLFKEVSCASSTGPSRSGPSALLEEFYPYLGGGGARRGPRFHALPARDGLARRSARLAPDPGRRRQPRCKAFYRPEIAAGIGETRFPGRLRDELPAGVRRLEHAGARRLARGATLLEPYLLAAQGDRVAMAHGVEGRFPVSRPSRIRLLRRAAAGAKARRRCATRSRSATLAADLLPRRSWPAPSSPTGRPRSSPSSAPRRPDWVEEALSPAALAETGIWDAGPRRRAVQRCRRGRATGDPRGDGAGRRSSRPSSGTRSSAGPAADAIRPRPRSHM